MVSTLTKAGILAVIVALIVRSKVLSKKQPPIFHKGCVGFSCKDIEGPGLDTCKNNIICPLQPMFHKECKNGVCTAVFGPGPSTCKVTGDCPP